MTNNRREREYLHYYRITSAMARGKEQWGVMTLRGAMMPPPARRECLALDQKLLCLAHSDDDPDEEGVTGGRTPLNSLRMLDMSDLGAKVLWEDVPIDNRKPPNAVAKPSGSASSGARGMRSRPSQCRSGSCCAIVCTGAQLLNLLPPMSSSLMAPHTLEISPSGPGSSMDKSGTKTRSITSKAC